MAVGLVIAFHFFPTAVPGGFVGVDIFFVISGYLITGILFAGFAGPGATGPQVIAEFYRRRIRRIFPALAVILLFSYLAAYSFFLSDLFSNFGRDLAASAGFVINLLLAKSTGYFGEESSSRALLHLWSLSVEEQFYLCWPLLIWGAVKLGRPLLPLAVFLAGLSFFATAYCLHPSGSTAFFLPDLRLWELLLGAILAAAQATPEGRRKQSLAPGWSHFVGGTGALLLIAGIYAVRWEERHPSALTLLSTAGALLLLVAGEQSWINRRILAHPLLVGIGLISYPLYLWHWPLLVFYKQKGSDLEGLPVRGGLIALSILLAWLTYLLVERPVRTGGRARWKFLTPLAVVAAMGLIGAYTHLRNGFPERFPNFIRRLMTMEDKHQEDWRFGTYLLQPRQEYEAFKVDPQERLPGQPTLFLWGDSYAAHLYSGLAKRYGGHYNLVQRTVGGTAPIPGMDFQANGPGSRALNDRIYHALLEMQPDWIVLAANWGLYDWRRIEHTIDLLQAAGFKHIWIIGPTPQWEGSGLRQQLYEYYRRHLPAPLPTHLRTGLSPGTDQIDVELGQLCERKGVRYVSPYRILSEPDGFLVRLDDTPESIIAIDRGHLSKRGSEYVVSRFPAD